jgi:hypothetical protein
MLAELHDARDTAVPTVCAALGLCAVTYAAVGVLVALVFGSWTVPVCTLNWSRADLGGWERVLVVLPVVDITASYPLLAHCLGRNLATATDVEPRIWRMVCALLPLVGAFFVFDLSVPATWVGATSAVVIYTVPFALWARSVRMAEEAFPAKELQANPYRMPSGGHIFYSGVVVNVLVAACSIAGAVLNRGH